MADFDETKTIAVEYAHRVWDKKDLKAIEDLLHKDVIIHSTLGDFHGHDSMKKVVQSWLIALPDLIVKNLAVVHENDLVAIHWQARGTHNGEFKGRRPTGKPVSYSGVTMYRVKNGKIVEYWAYLDMQHIFNQIS